jgi:hypothetical protein
MAAEIPSSKASHEEKVDHRHVEQYHYGDKVDAESLQHPEDEKVILAPKFKLPLPNTSYR